jgi:hypothetical protein
MPLSGPFAAGASTNNWTFSFRILLVPNWSCLNIFYISTPMWWPIRLVSVAMTMTNIPQLPIVIGNLYPWFNHYAGMLRKTMLIFTKTIQAITHHGTGITRVLIITGWQWLRLRAAETYKYAAAQN